jgi:hypothetical protein
LRFLLILFYFIFFFFFLLAPIALSLLAAERLGGRNGGQPPLSTKDILAAVCDVQKAILVLLLLVEVADEGVAGGQGPVPHPPEDRLLWRQRQLLPDFQHKLGDAYVCGRHVLPLHDVGEVGGAGLAFVEEVSTLFFFSSPSSPPSHSISSAMTRGGDGEGRKDFFGVCARALLPLDDDEDAVGVVLQYVLRDLLAFF